MATTILTIDQARADKAIEFSFPFHGCTWTFIVSKSAAFEGSPKVYVYEDSERAAMGYVMTDDGPMFDGPFCDLGGRSNGADNEDGERMEAWGEMIAAIWQIVRPEYKRAALAM